MSDRDYRKLYQIQNKVLEVLHPLLGDFYLTGGTALGRFFLHHRFSEDLDFFVNSDPGFRKKMNLIENILNTEFILLRDQALVYEDYARYLIAFKDSLLKIEFVNDVEYRSGKPMEYKFGLLDTPLNILTNKLTAIVSRDEPKDIFDIYSIAGKWSFNWMKMFEEAKKKVILNEIDVEQRIRNFPVMLLDHVDWVKNSFNPNLFSQGILEIANDFILGKDNSLGKNQVAIENAVPDYDDFT